MATWLHSDAYPTLKISNKRILKSWISDVIKSYGKIPGEINIIFMSDEELLEINRSHLNHNFFTDVITFDYCDNLTVSGDVYISIDRIAENAKSFNTEFNQECLRVTIHGILHLLGFKDSKEEQKVMMRKLEDRHLQIVKATLIFSK